MDGSGYRRVGSVSTSGDSVLVRRGWGGVG